MRDSVAVVLCASCGRCVLGRRELHEQTTRGTLEQRDQQSSRDPLRCDCAAVGIVYQDRATTNGDRSHERQKT